MRIAAITSLVLLAGCVNPMYQGHGANPSLVQHQPPAAATARSGWGNETQGRAVDPSVPQAPQPAPASLGWGQTAAGDRPTGTARTVPPGSSGAGSVPVVDLQRGIDGPVPAQPLGTLSGIEGAPRSSIDSSSRASLFEQFQRLEEDRDALRQQVAAMQSEFERMSNLAAQQAQLQDTSNRESSSLRARIEHLEEHNRQLAAENEDLAGRLLTAQIRRLEAEKTLLEHLITSEQSRTSGPASNGATVLPAPASQNAGAPSANITGGGAASAGGSDR